MIMCLVVLITGFILHSLFKIALGCITTVLFCHSMRKTTDHSIAEWDGLMEE